MREPMIEEGAHHSNCDFCDEQYLFSGYCRLPHGLSSSAVVERKHEGWPGIPHGGVGMSSLVELADLYNGQIKEYPWRAEFRFGGEKIGIGDEVALQVCVQDSVCSGEITKKGGRHPYLKCTITNSDTDTIRGNIDYLVDLVTRPVAMKGSFRIPVFSERVIFRNGFRDGNTHRIFDIREDDRGATYMACRYGSGNDLMNCACMNRISDDRVHPGSLISILDETMGWSGFLTVWQGGVTVNLDLHFLRALTRNDMIFSAGLCTNIRGAHRRKIVTCEGGIFAVRDDTIVPTVYARGRWLTDPTYKEKMLCYIMPETLGQITALQK